MAALSAGGEQGQAVTEYILLVAIVTAIFLAVAGALANSGLSGQILADLTTDFAKSYQYGHPKALGFDDGGPKKHPRADPSGGGENGNFRIFIVKPP